MLVFTLARPSKWGNPFTIGVANYTRDQAIRRFAQYLRANPRLMAAAKRELRGKDLVCFCAPKPCHGDLLLRSQTEDTTRERLEIKPSSLDKQVPEGIQVARHLRCG